MKILSAAQIRLADQYTIAHEPISSLALMERAATQCTQWLTARLRPHTPVWVFAGTGNNGGDGLAIARQLHGQGYATAVFVLGAAKYSADCAANLTQYEALGLSINYLHHISDFPPIPPNVLVVDALFGSGLNRPCDGLAAALIEHLNASRANIVAIDLPSGLFCEDNSQNIDENIIAAGHTLSLHLPKLALLLPDYQHKIGQMHVLPIGLNEDFIKNQHTDYQFITLADCAAMYRPRQQFGHKGTYGHALVVAGSRGKMGAAVLATRASLRAGAGLVSVLTAECGYTILQTTAPEAMTLLNEGENYLQGKIPELTAYQAIGVGCGIGTETETAMFLGEILGNYQRPMVIDADALNVLATRPDWHGLIPAQSILTPHPKEFSRWAGRWDNDTHKLQLLNDLSKKLQCHIVLKGAYTAIAHPNGQVTFNSTGNAGMATGGSGDTLTGILTALLAQGYTPETASILGVWLHGFAGDCAAAHYGQEALIASDLAEFLGEGFKALGKEKQQNSLL
ncbi:NAD(P)H-hydrate epimerase [Flexibacter flexilis DSM 6793]|uniref:Bifunctional NAD(P)H-hydrate repair enzyme n=1 Tax=Flexibacter flexilis DSM 6793 TaxID=927664 RepID=A0A1I1NF01_9BACT|nr:NAD(P)H-hydrate dehydratase [Flexibacter flexilis]SFC92300.1 NAD(P)H-hydrate epimerase [Flexibacter flexilis DSM 6793]